MLMKKGLHSLWARSHQKSSSLFTQHNHHHHQQQHPSSSLMTMKNATTLQQQSLFSTHVIYRQSQQQQEQQQQPALSMTPPKLIVLVGPPASGKGTQTRLLVNRHPSEIKIVSAEDTLREAAKNDQELSELLRKGELAPNELTDQLLQQCIIQQSASTTTTTSSSSSENEANVDNKNESEEKSVDQNKRVIILEGYPRDVEQAKRFLSWFSDKKLSVRKSHVFILHLLSDRENIMKRLQGRLIHANSGRPYHVTFNPPHEEMKDDVTGEALMRREDDQDKNAILKRLALYREETLPMIDFLAEHEFDVTDIVQGEDDIMQVSERIEQILREKGVLSPGSS